MKTYIGTRDAQSNCEVKVEVDGRSYPLRHTILHSPAGYNWGYSGSGPADLALSILCDHLGEHPTAKQLRAGETKAQRLHQKFKFKFVAGWEQTWQINEDEIAAWIKESET